MPGEDPRENTGASRFLLKDYTLWRTRACAREKCEKEGAAERSRQPLVLIFLCCSGKRGREMKKVVKLSLGRRSEEYVVLFFLS